MLSKAKKFSDISDDKEKVKVDIFQGKLFAVIGGHGKWKEDMEGKIRQYGGQTTASVDVEGVFAIIGRETTCLVKTAIKVGKWDVIDPSWIEKCIENGKRIPLYQEDYVFMKKDTKEAFNRYLFAFPDDDSSTDYSDG